MLLALPVPHLRSLDGIAVVGVLQGDVCAEAEQRDFDVHHRADEEACIVLDSYVLELVDFSHFGEVGV